MKDTIEIFVIKCLEIVHEILDGHVMTSYKSFSRSPTKLKGIALYLYDTDVKLQSKFVLKH